MFYLLNLFLNKTITSVVKDLDRQRPEIAAVYLS